MKDFILIFISIFTILSISTKLVRNIKIKFHFIYIVILGGKIFFLSSLFVIPAFVLLNFSSGFEKLIPNLIKFSIALLIVSFLSIPLAIILNKFDPLAKK